MPVRISDLQSFYDAALFSEGSKEVRITEKQNKEAGLACVMLSVEGQYILLHADFLKQTETLYRKIDKHLSFRSVNDGTLLIKTTDGKRYLIYMELKSGYNDVCKKAVYQIPVSSIKIKSYLRNMAGYIPGEYQEAGLIISYPPRLGDRLDAVNNSMVFDSKQTYMDQLAGRASNSIDESLRRNGQVTLNSDDFPALNQQFLHPDIQFRTMNVFYRSVTSDNETVDLMPILNQI